MPEDLAAEKEELIGNGFDSHRFCEGDGLLIGGFKVPYKFSLEAHSDGDIVLHALIDSMLALNQLRHVTQYLHLNELLRKIYTEP